MRPSSRYAIASTAPSTGLVTLARGSARLSRGFEGACIEAQFGLGDDQTLVWLSDDSPYDARLHVYLFDANDVVLDAFEGGGVFTPGIFKAVQHGDAWLNFEFFTNDIVYRVSVNAAARFRFGLPAGWKYKHPLRRHQLTLQSLENGKT